MEKWLGGSTFWQTTFWNAIVVTAYHMVIFVIAVKRPQSAFREDQPRYRMKKFERGGRFYKKTLKIHLWKEFVPQFIGRDGFSKEHLEREVSAEYLDAFIAETCRGEWTHRIQGWSAVFVCIWNPPLLGLLFAGVILLISLPCVAIQRYNRFRLQTLRKRLLRSGSAA